MLYFLEQCLNGIQLGMLLFLLAAGLTLVFGIMDLVNLAHGSLYMLGAYFAATFAAWTGSFILAAVLARGATLLFARVALLTGWGRRVWGRAGRNLPVPSWLGGAVEVLPGIPFPAYRLAI